MELTLRILPRRVRLMNDSADPVLDCEVKFGQKYVVNTMQGLSTINIHKILKSNGISEVL